MWRGKTLVPSRAVASRMEAWERKGLASIISSKPHAPDDVTLVQKEERTWQTASLLAYLQEHRPSQCCHPGCSPASLSLLCCWLSRRCAARPHSMHPMASFFYADSLPWLPGPPGIPVWAQCPEKYHLKMFPLPHTLFVVVPLSPSPTSSQHHLE